MILCGWIDVHIKMLVNIVQSSFLFGDFQHCCLLPLSCCLNLNLHFYHLCFFRRPVQIESKLFVAKFTFVTLFLGQTAYITHFFMKSESYCRDPRTSCCEAGSGETEDYPQEAIGFFSRWGTLVHPVVDLPFLGPTEFFFGQFQIQIRTEMEQSQCFFDQLQ